MKSQTITLTPNTKKVLIELVKEKMQGLAFDANIYAAGVVTPVGKRRYEKYVMLAGVMKELEHPIPTLFD